MDTPALPPIEIPALPLMDAPALPLTDALPPTSDALYVKDILELYEKFLTRQNYGRYMSNCY